MKQKSITSLISLFVLIGLLPGVTLAVQARGASAPANYFIYLPIVLQLWRIFDQGNTLAAKVVSNSGATIDTFTITK